MTAEQIFADAKARFHYASDQCVFGKAEYWASLGELSRDVAKTGIIDGDCDDFASWCVGQLRAAGLPARYIVCQVETGEWHCIAESNSMILDNRQAEVMPLFMLPYQPGFISGFRPGDPWHSYTLK